MPVRSSLERHALRFPVQSVIRPDAAFRGFAGRLASGTLHAGDEILVLPSRQSSRVESIVSFDGDLENARPGQSVVVKLTREIDVSRGDLFVSRDDQPHVSNRFSAMVVWLHASRLELNRTYLAKHGGRLVKVKATRICYRVDVNQLTEGAADHLDMNEIGLVEFEANQPLYFDPYHRNRTTGSLVLIDSLSNATIGAVMIRKDLSANPEGRADTRITPGANTEPGFELEARIRRHGHRPAVFALAGERSRAEQLERDLFERGFEAAFVNQDDIPAAARKIFFSTLWNLGLVVIVWAVSRFSSRDRGLLTAIARESFFDFSSANAFESSEALRIAETVRLRGTRHDEKEN